MKVGDWPYCPHGPANWRVDAFEGYWDENLGPDPVWITSAHQRRKIMDEKGFDYVEDKDRTTKKRTGGAPLFFDMSRR
jgi:hypothetical protein